MGAQASVANCCAGRDKLGDGSLPLHSSQRCLADEVSASAPRARRGCKFGDGCRRGNPSHFVDESHPGDPDAVVGRPRVPLVQPGPQLASREKSFEWVRTANEKEDRELRGATASLTLKACHASGYQLDNDVVALRMVDQMLQGTRMLTLEEVSATLSAPFFASRPRLRRSRCLALEAAQGARVAVLSAASAYHPCGGFRSGGRHALEEAMCVQSTLCVSLQRALYLSQHGSYKVELPQRLVADGRTSAWFCYISERGCILSPHVEVFRQGSNAGYGFMAEPQELAAVVSVAMPNKNPAVRDSPLDAPGQAEEYHDLLVAKLKVALGAAALAGATTVVVPGLGCGVFKNAPEDVGRALKEALAWPPLRQLEEIILAAVPDAFAAAAGA